MNQFNPRTDRPLYTHAASIRYSSQDTSKTNRFLTPLSHFLEEGNESKAMSFLTDVFLDASEDKKVLEDGLHLYHWMKEKMRKGALKERFFYQAVKRMPEVYFYAQDQHGQTLLQQAIEEPNYRLAQALLKQSPVQSLYLSNNRHENTFDTLSKAVKQAPAFKILLNMAYKKTSESIDSKAKNIFSFKNIKKMLARMKSL